MGLVNRSMLTYSSDVLGSLWSNRAVAVAVVPVSATRDTTWEDKVCAFARFFFMGLLLSRCSSRELNDILEHIW